MTLDHSQGHRVEWGSVDAQRFASQSRIGRRYCRHLYMHLRRSGLARPMARSGVKYALGWADLARYDGWVAGLDAMTTAVIKEES